jgi:hypothetical protein
MAQAVAEMDPVERARATVGVFVTLAGSACGLTMLYMGMRAVMGIGGFCAEGGPFVIEQHCPTGVPGLVLGGIWGGIIFFGLYVWQTLKRRIPSFFMLGWSALFLSLGWNFLEFGLNPPGPDTSLVWGWLICAIMFGLMGGLPLLAVTKPTLTGFFGDSDPEPQTGGGVFSSTFGATATMVRNRVRTRGTAVDSGGVVSRGAKLYWLSVQLAAIAAGIYLGLMVYEAVSK